MRINIQNMLRQAGHAIPSDRDTGAYSFVLQQLGGHLLQLRDRTQAGDLTALDEFFKLYVFNDGKDYTRSPAVCAVCGGKGRIDTIRIGNVVNIPCPDCSAKETGADRNDG